jgi:serine/threonine-protein kinase
MLKFWKRDEPPAREDTDRIPERITWAAVPRWRLLAVLLLSLVNAAAAGALVLQHHGDPQAAAAVAQVCGVGADSGCEAVARSPYSTVRGVPVAAIGLAFSLSVGLLAFLGVVGGPDTRAAAAAIALALLGLALLVAVVLLGIQVFAIKALCKLCILTYALNALAFVVLLPTRRDRTALRGGIRYPEGRVALAGWALGSLAVLAAVVAADKALAARGGGPAAVLGAPAAAPSLPPAPAGSEAQRYQEEARVAHEEARRLQQILDDPRKLEEYFAQKAAREFEQGPVANLNLKGVPAKGPAEAPIRVVEFSDFLCPYCRQIAGPLGAYVTGAAGRVVLYFKNYPLDQACNPSLSQTIHPGACALALGAICAQDQGKFWPYHDRVFAATPRNPGTAEVVALASSAGLDGAAMSACLTGASARSRLAAEIQEAKDARVDATPTLFINGRKLPRVDLFVQTMDREAARMGLPPIAPPAAPHPPSGH